MKLHEKTTVTCAEMKELERLADSAGLSYRQMMENAGQGAAKAALDAFKKDRGTLPKKSVIFTGKGNNGGDGFVMARAFHERGIDVVPILVDGIPVTDDAVYNHEILDEETKRKTVSVKDFTPNENLTDTLIVDAVYGTGFHGSFRPSGRLFADLVREMKGKGSFTVSVDIPSGLSGDIKDIRENEERDPVSADFTVTFHARKPVHDANGAEQYLGEVKTCDIGIKDVLG